MRTKLIPCTAAALILSSTAIASAQGGMTDRNGASNGSQHVGNGAATQQPSGTVGMSNTVRSERDSRTARPARRRRQRPVRQVTRRKTTTRRSNECLISVGKPQAALQLGVCRLRESLCEDVRYPRGPADA